MRRRLSRHQFRGMSAAPHCHQRLNRPLSPPREEKDGERRPPNREVALVRHSLVAPPHEPQRRAVRLACPALGKVSRKRDSRKRGRRDALPYVEASPVQGVQARIARSGNSLPHPLPALRWRGEGVACGSPASACCEPGRFAVRAGLCSLGASDRGEMTSSLLRVRQL